MRSLLLLLLSIAVLGGAFALYAFMQTPPPAMEGDSRDPVAVAPTFRPPPAKARQAEAQPTTSTAEQPSTGVSTGTKEPAIDPNERIIGAGDNVWVKAFDKENRLTNEFRAARYDPQGDTVHVTRPQTRFYLADGDVLVIEAERGQVVIPASSGQRETLGDSRAQTPTRGELFDVTLSLLESANATEPIVQCKMNNIAFDNDTFRIATESFTDASGKNVPADQVPIQMRGRDYDFDGFGLVIRWNEVDRRLQLLEIARGESLVVKNPASVQLDAPVGTAPKGGDEKAPQKPIVVKWSGPLRVVPGKTSKTIPVQRYRAMLTDNVRITQEAEELATADMLEIAFAVQGDEKASAESDRPVVVSLSGSPTVVKMQGVQARAAVVTYDTSTGSALLKSSPEFPQIGLQDPSGRTMLARQVDYDRKAGKATLLGPAKFEVPLPADAAGGGAGPRVLVADAAKQCIVQIDTENKDFAVKSATLEGDVAIDHPQLKMNCETLSMTFAKDGPKNDFAVDGITADGNVKAMLLDSRGQAQKIEAQTLAMKANSVDGKFGAESLHASGGVKIDSSSQQITAGTLDVAFAARKADAAVTSFLGVGEDEVSSMLAQTDVRLRSSDGASISAEKVSYNKDPAAPRDHLRVEGAPATIGDARGTLSAQLIDFNPATGSAKVVGGGRFNTTFATNKDQPGQPVAVVWAGDLLFDPSTNVAAINDGVTIESEQAEGVHVRGTARSLLLNFNTPESSDKSPDKSTDKSAGAPLAGREIRDVTLSGDVQFAAMQNDAAGALAQRMHLFSEKLSYRPSDGQISVPIAGRMLVEDRRPDEAKSAGTTAQLSSPRGATAFQWAEHLSFLPAKNLAEMNGDVLVVHQPSSPNGKQLRLNADSVEAQLADKGAATASTSPIGATPQLNTVKAKGNVRFASDKLEFYATEVELRPQEDMLIARGAPGVPATMLDQNGMSKGSFSEMWMNTRTNESNVKDFRVSVRQGGSSK